MSSRGRGRSRGGRRREAPAATNAAGHDGYTFYDAGGPSSDDDGMPSLVEDSDAITALSAPPDPAGRNERSTGAAAAAAAASDGGMPGLVPSPDMVSSPGSPEEESNVDGWRGNAAVRSTSHASTQREGSQGSVASTHRGDSPPAAVAARSSGPRATATQSQSQRPQGLFGNIPLRSLATPSGFSLNLRGIASGLGTARDAQPPPGQEPSTSSSAAAADAGGGIGPLRGQFASAVQMGALDPQYRRFSGQAGGDGLVDFHDDYDDDDDDDDDIVDVESDGSQDSLPPLAGPEDDAPPPPLGHDFTFGSGPAGMPNPFFGMMAGGQVVTGGAGGGGRATGRGRGQASSASSRGGGGGCGGSSSGAPAAAAARSESAYEQEIRETRERLGHCLAKLEAEVEAKEELQQENDNHKRHKKEMQEELNERKRREERFEQERAQWDQERAKLQQELRDAKRGPSSAAAAAAASAAPAAAAAAATHRLEVEVERLNEEMRKKNQKIENQKNHITNVEASHKAKVEGLEKSVQDLRAKERAANEAKRAAERDRDRARGEMAAIDRVRDELRVERDRVQTLNEELQTTRQQRDDMQQQRDTARNETEAVRTEKDTERDELRGRLQRQIEQLELELAKAKSATEAAENEKAALNADMERREQQIGQLEKRLEEESRHKATLHQLQRQHRQTLEENRRMVSRTEQLEQAVAAMQKTPVSDAHTHSDDPATLKAALKQMEQDRNRLESDQRSEIKQGYQQLQKSIREIRRLREELKRAKANPHGIAFPTEIEQQHLLQVNRVPDLPDDMQQHEDYARDLHRARQTLREQEQRLAAEKARIDEGMQAAMRNMRAAMGRAAECRQRIDKALKGVRDEQGRAEELEEQVQWEMDHAAYRMSEPDRQRELKEVTEKVEAKEKERECIACYESPKKVAFVYSPIDNYPAHLKNYEKEQEDLRRRKEEQRKRDEENRRRNGPPAAAAAAAAASSSSYEPMSLTPAPSRPTDGGELRCAVHMKGVLGHL
ncbi:unnamed protein product [Vitrella brassicaformis CCMP3155]|uniref:Uncharacterized protein n=2 Tax=Vitrella brassicaformis TaxID=1169539 RepID=A0A0G4E8T3_VITBC|nr:unnamed protein product [Vitrella brassicaformis CCMP3155]|eukprot:CEL91809.1 unnamed protein product [Vitrella brassicaformis CCMP3155]